MAELVTATKRAKKPGFERSSRDNATTLSYLLSGSHAFDGAGLFRYNGLRRYTQQNLKVGYTVNYE
jgi:hypothetical protein